jgi:ABC-type nitrate/sulfonate/bicarbonate transport system substrate-binding protein
LATLPKIFTKEHAGAAALAGDSLAGGVICVHRSDIPRRSSPALLASLDEGGIDAAVLTLPTFFLAEDKGYRVVGDPNTMDIYYLQNTLETTRSYIKKNRKAVIKFLKGYIEGIAYFKKNKKESLDIMGKKLRIQSFQERDVRYMEMSYNLMIAAYNDVLYPSLKAVQAIVDKVAEEDPRVKEAISAPSWMRA